MISTVKAKITVNLMYEDVKIVVARKETSWECSVKKQFLGRYYPRKTFFLMDYEGIVDGSSLLLGLAGVLAVKFMCRN